MKMRKRNRRKDSLGSAALVVLALVIVALYLGAPGLVRASRQSGLTGNEVDRATRDAKLRLGLSSTDTGEFKSALSALASLEGEGSLEVWQEALQNPVPALRRDAWAAYQGVRAYLFRRAYAPQVAGIRLAASEVVSLARSAGREVTIWSARPGYTVAALPPVFADHLRDSGYELTILYDSISDWQDARFRGDPLALEITPPYQSEDAAGAYQVRIAIVDLGRLGTPAAGYSEWSPDGENILMRTGSIIAYVDIFVSDGSPQSIQAHLDENYRRRGCSVLGFYTPSEFADIAPGIFAGREFQPGREPGVQAQGKVSSALAEGAFHSYEETLAEFKALAEQHPELARLVNLGPSYENRQVFALKISKGVTVDDANKPDILVTGGHHAREWISVEPPVYFANKLLKEYETDDSIKHLVDNLEIWIVPIVNPDGLTYSQGAPNNRIDPVRLWRKNRRPISSAECGSGIGVDLNRNYDFKWRLSVDQPCPSYSDDLGASDSVNGETYRGPAPTSEPEIKAMQALLDDPNHSFRAHLDYHNFSQLVLYPWGHIIHPAPDKRTLATVSKKVSDAIVGKHRKVYQPQQAVELYVTTGTATDYSYGGREVPLPLVIEVRPECCSFTVLERDIPGVNEENWEGARVALNWATGPPFVKMVHAYQRGSDGTFSKLVYSARWVDTAETPGRRRLVVDTRFPGLEPGDIQVRIQFSKPMDTSSPFRATIGRGNNPEEARFIAVDGSGWTRTEYAGDTWVGVTTIFHDEDESSEWYLSVSAIDINGFVLDSLPETVADFGTGTDRWRNYENQDGVDSLGGLDRQHTLAPTVRVDMLTVIMGSPRGGERLAAGDVYEVVWRIAKDSGFVPAIQDLWLSLDGGFSYTPVAQSMPGHLERVLINVPQVTTTRGRMRLLARQSGGNTVFGDSLADFTIGANVGSGVEIAFTSAQKVNLGWTDSASGASGSFQFVINVSITNKGEVPVARPFLRVAELTRNNVLLSRDPQSPPGRGARQLMEAGTDDVLDAGQAAEVRLVIGVVSKKKFELSVGLYGVAVEGSIAAASPTRVWLGKPKVK